MRLRSSLPVCVAALWLAACSKHEPAPAAPPAPAKTVARSAAPAAPRERGEYSALPEGVSPQAEAASTRTDDAIAGEALRGGPRGEPRIFENAQEQAELARGSSPRYMNGQFRYYLAGLSVVPPQGDCKKPLLAIRLAVENLHGTPTSAIYGRFTFAQTTGGEGSTLTETVAVPYRADIIGPFSNKQGGVVYVTAYAQQIDAYTDAGRWDQIVAINPARRKVWFTPEAFYYPDGTQYAQRSGNGPATREVMTCGGSEGATRAVAR